jgi:ABC-type multidrug transport system ATPase subunit
VFSSYTEMMIIGAIFVACVLLFAITKFTASRQKKMFGTRIELTEEDEDDLDNYSTSTEVSLTFADVNYTVSGKSILSNVNGYVEPGQMLAVMGPSGAGKSSLLDILSRKHKRGIATGSILINGASPTRRQFKRLTGFVDQDDSLMGTLTVRETLTYAALMRLPRKMPLKAKQRRVEDVIQELGISKIADSQIGIPGQRGISGGEKRRVSIGKELVTSPSLLFLDEPTSGLDAYNAGVVMDCLKRLAHEGKRTIIVTIHQPRSNIFKMFDSLMLLSGGQTVSLLIKTEKGLFS